VQLQTVITECLKSIKHIIAVTNCCKIISPLLSKVVAKNYGCIMINTFKRLISWLELRLYKSLKRIINRLKKLISERTISRLES